MALQAIKQDPNLNIKRAFQIYKIPRTTLIARRDDRILRHDISANSINLIILKEETIFKRTINLIECGFPPRQNDIRDMANLIRVARNAPPVGSR